MEYWKYILRWTHFWETGDNSDHWSWLAFHEALLKFLSVQFISATQLCPALCDPMDSSTSGFPVHHQLPEFTQAHVHCIDDAIQPSYPLSYPSPPAFNLFQHRCLSNELALRMDWPKCWSFSFSISPFNEYSRLISFMIDWFDLLVSKRLKSFLQHHSS